MATSALSSLSSTSRARLPASCRLAKPSTSPSAKTGSSTASPVSTLKVRSRRERKSGLLMKTLTPAARASSSMSLQS